VGLGGKYYLTHAMKEDNREFLSRKKMAIQGTLGVGKSHSKGNLKQLYCLTMLQACGVPTRENT
jgi:hypothetical protein